MLQSHQIANNFQHYLLQPGLTPLPPQLPKVIAAAGEHLARVCQHQGVPAPGRNQADPVTGFMF